MIKALVRRPDGTEFLTAVSFRDEATVVTSFGTFVQGRWVAHEGFQIVDFVQE